MTYVDLNLSIMLAKLLLLLGRDILIAEEDNASFGDQQCQFVPLLIREVFELKPMNLSTDMSCEIFDLACSLEKRLLGWICLLCPGSSIIVFPRFVSDVVGVLEIEGTSWTIRVTTREVNVGSFEASSSLFWKPKSVFLWLDHICDRGVNSTRSHDGEFAVILAL